ncbi:DUF3040 domain-containing protein [Geodermatophilus sp. SYSU D00697]
MTSGRRTARLSTRSGGTAPGSRQHLLRAAGTTGPRRVEGPDAEERRRREREALADLRDALERDDPELSRSFGALARPHPVRWLAGLAGCAVLAGAAFAVLGVRAVGVLGLVLVLGAPVLVCLACAGSDEPVEGAPPTA